MQRKSLRLIAMMLIVFASLIAKANPVDMRTVREVAMKFVNANAKVPLRSAEDLQLVTTYSISRGDVAFHVFNTPNGFVIVAADDCATPILGYSDEGRPFDLDNVPIQLQGYLQGFVEQIQYGIENHVQDETSAQQWELVRNMGRLNNNRDGDAVEPLITATWGQGCMYNAMCPEDEDGQCGHLPTGCVATAMGMIMNYWGYPTHGNGSHTYTPLGYQAQVVDFGETTYDWSNMPNQLTEHSTQTEIEAVSKLLWHCGVSVDMAYALGGSGASNQSAVYALSSCFNFNCSQLEELGINNYTTTDVWLDSIKSNLNENIPIYYSGYSTDYSYAHAWVCDGYDMNNLLHFNWGWNGSANGYFAIGALNVLNYEFNTSNQAVFGIHPSCNENSSIQITVNVSTPDAGYIFGDGVYSCENECNLTAVPNDGYKFLKWTEDGQVISINPSISFWAVSDRIIEAHFVEEENVCALVFDLYDSCGDGMNGNGLDVHYGDGTWERLSFGAGFSASFNRFFVDDSHVILYWWPGNYWTENSYVIKFENGAIIYENHGLNEYLTNGNYEFDLSCEDQFLPRSINVCAIPEGRGSVSGGGEYFPGQVCTITAVADEGFVFSCWKEDGELITTDSNYSFTVGIVDRNYVACFGPYMVDVSTNTAEGGVVNGGGGMYEYGQECSVMAIPKDGYVFQYWTENGMVVSTDQTYSFLVLDDRELKANFIEEDVTCAIVFQFDGFNWAGHVMTVHYGDGMTENISPEEWANYPSYTRVVQDNSHIMLSWTDGGMTWGWSFGVFYENGALIHNGSWEEIWNFEFDVDCNSAYLPKEISADANPIDGGVITGDGLYDVGDICTLTAASNEGFVFYNWTEDGEEVSTDPTYTFVVTGLRNFTANFAKTITTCFPQGWNWFTPMVATTIEDIQTALGENYVDIISEHERTSSDIMPGEMLRIQTNNSCMFSLTGVPFTAAAITINQGENWIGFIGSEKTVAAAFANFTPTEGDKVISQDEGFAVFENGEWHGTLDTLEPGKGYVYVSNATEPKTLVIGN